MDSLPNIDVPAPRVRLTSLPSPLERALRLEASLAESGCERVPRIFLKRDDLLSLGMGGNKVRNLEFLLGAALEERASDVVTAGRAQSNHCRITAAACARLGLGAHLVLMGARPARLTGNLLLDDLLGAKLYFAGSESRDDRAALVERVRSDLEREGRKPFVIPVGGSDMRGAFGHVLAAREIAVQCLAAAGGLDAIVLGTATGGTQAGLLVGLNMLGLRVRVHGFAVAKSGAELAGDIARLAGEVAAALSGARIEASAILVDDSMLGGGYGVPTREGQAAIELFARSEGVFADPVYTGKGLAGLIAMIRGGRFALDETVVFVHTGGAPALFADASM